MYVKRRKNKIKHQQSQKRKEKKKQPRSENKILKGKLLIKGSNERNNYTEFIRISRII